MEDKDNLVVDNWQDIHNTLVLVSILFKVVEISIAWLHKYRSFFREKHLTLGQLLEGPRGQMILSMMLELLGCFLDSRANLFIYMGVTLPQLFTLGRLLCCTGSLSAS